METFPRLIRPAPEPLGLYFRAGYNDQRVLLSLFSEDRIQLATGVVFDAAFVRRNRELLEELGHRRLRAILDPCTMELGTAGGFASSKSELPWAGPQLHMPSDFDGGRADDLVASIVRFVVANGFSAVLAPTHYVSEAGIDWLHVDAAVTKRLRRAFDRVRPEVPIYYPLAVHRHLLRRKSFKQALLPILRELDIDALWLRIHPFGSRSGPAPLRAYIETCRELHSLGVPIVAERTGTIGLALLAFGAVGGIESGITLREHFDVNSLLKPRGGSSFPPQLRVYIPQIGAFLSRKQAREFFDARGMKSKFACGDTDCCRRGARDMIDFPRRHYLIQRTREIRRLSNVPEHLRPQIYLEEFLRPATDSMIAAVRVAPNLQATKQRLDSWRQTLGEMLRSGRAQSASRAVPAGGSRIVHRRGA